MKTFSLGHTAIALLLAIFTVIILMITVHDIGLTWDEPVYIEASESYFAWFGELVSNPPSAFSDQTIKQYWELNHEHPPFDKVWSGLVWSVAKNVFDDLTAHRLGNILLTGLLVGLVYLLLAQEYGRLAGLAAVGALLTMPRFFFHAHLAALDVPTSVTIFLVCLVFWRTIERREHKWTLLLGIVFGLAFATKINGFFEVPILLFTWALVFRRQLFIFARLMIGSVIGFLFWIISWPWLYHDTWNRLIDYFGFLTINHYKIEQWYRFHLYDPPPWHYPFVMTLAVVPLTLIILCALGILYTVKSGRTHALGWLLIMGLLIPMIILASDLTQVFDDERLLMPVFPFLATLAGIGFSVTVQSIQRVALRMNRQSWNTAVVAMLAIATFTPQVVLASALYPHLLSYYSIAIGRLSGAARSGLESTYWAETYAAALPFLNTHARPGALVWVEAHDVMLYYQLHGNLRSDLRIASPFGNEDIVKGTQGYKASIEDADYAVIEYRQSGFSGEIVNWIEQRKPDYELDYDLVPLMAIYER